MKITRLVKALEKAGLTVEKVDRNEYKKNIGHYDGPFWHYICKGPKYVGDWYPNGGQDIDTCSVQIMRHNDRNDYQSDYFAGSFYNTIKSIVTALTQE